MQWHRDDDALVRRLHAAFATRDLDMFLDLLHPDVELFQSGALPWGGAYRGRAGAARFIRALLAHVDPHLVLGSVVHAGDAVIETGRTRGTALATGRTFDVAEVRVLRIRAGLVVRFEAFVDADAFLLALG